jgi:hypothetical protein
MKEIIDVAFKIDYDDTRAEILHVTLSYLRNLPIKSLYFWWIKMTQVLRERTRKSLLVDISILSPIIYYLGKDETIFEISEAILNVSRWWP